MNLSRYIWKMPTALKTIDDIQKRLSRHGIVLWLLFSETILEPELYQNLTEGLRAKFDSSNLRSIEVNKWEGKSPFEILKTLFAPDVVNLDELAVHISSPHVLLLRGLHLCNKETIEQWFYMAKRWIYANQRKGDERSVLFLVPGDFAQKFQLENLGLAEYQFIRWMAPESVYEIKLIFRLAINNQENTYTSLWREEILAALCGSDMKCAGVLWESATLPIEKTMDSLKQYGKDKHWDDENVNRDLELLLIEKSHKLPKNLSLWSSGLLTWTEEYGTEIHSAHLSIVGRNEEIYQRLWRAQASLVLPAVDNIRRQLCDLLKQKFPNEWLSFQRPENWFDYIEFKDILEFLNKNTDKNLMEHKKIIELTLFAREIRNCLAHYHPIEYGQIQNLFTLTEVAGLTPPF
jgi:hypothetical protein